MRRVISMHSRVPDFVRSIPNCFLRFVKVSLCDLISQHAADLASQADWSGVAGVLNSIDQAVPIRALRTTRWLMTQLTEVVDSATGATVADLVLDVLQRSSHPRVIAAYQAMSGEGIDLSDPQVQSMISVIGKQAAWPDALVERLKSSGFEKRSLASLAGFGIVSVEQVQSAWASGQARDSGNVVYDQHRVLLSLNSTPENSLLSLQITATGEFGGVSVDGDTRRVHGSSTSLNGKESVLLAAVNKAVSEYLSEV
jgi:hypothetical protein